MRTKGILFDLDQTLIDRDATFINFLEGQFCRFAAAFRSVDLSTYTAYLKEHDNNGYTPKEQLFEQVVADLALDVDPRELLLDFRKNYGLQPTLFEDALDTLTKLSETYILGLITNGRSESQTAKISNSGIRQFFHAICISEEEGIKKPDPIIYNRCLERLGLTAEVCVFVGDHPNFDVEVPRGLGMRAIWLANDNFPAPTDSDGIISRLSQLPGLLRQLNESENRI